MFVEDILIGMDSLRGDNWYTYSILVIPVTFILVCVILPKSYVTRNYLQVETLDFHSSQ